MKPARKREMVDHVRAAWRVSIRRACRAVPVDRSTYHYRSKRAGQAPLGKRIKEIAETRVRYGYPKTIRLDNGPEFISRELDLWAFMHDVTLDFSRPGKPTDNAFIESLNGKFRAECLNVHWFLSLDEAREKCEAWRRDYNEVRPHSAIGNLVPAALHRAASNPGQLAAR